MTKCLQLYISFFNFKNNAYNRKIISYMTQKEKDFLEAYNKCMKNIKRPVVMKVHEICRLVALSPAPRFYVSVEEALRQYRRYKRTGQIDFPRQSTRKMYMEIFRRYEEALEKCGASCFKFSIMNDILESQAPCFYMETSSAFKFYYRAMSHKRKSCRR